MIRNARQSSPAIVSIKGPAARTYGDGAALSFKAAFSSKVVVVGRPTLPVTIGDTTRDVPFERITGGGREVIFTTRVAAGDRDADGITLAGSILLPVGATIRTAAGVDASPGLPARLPNLRRVLIDGVGPRVTEISVPHVAGRSVTVRVRFDEAVKVIGRPFIPALVGGQGRRLTFETTIGNTATFAYRLNAGESPTMIVASSRITLPAGASVRDAASTPAVSLGGPSDITLSSNSILENAGANVLVGTLSTVDPGAANVFTYAMVSGMGDNDNHLFNISGNQLRAAVSLDFETKNAYSVRVQSTDRTGLLFEKTFSISVADIDDDDGFAAVAVLLRDVKDLGGEPSFGGLVPGAWDSSPDAFTTVGTTTYFVADGNRQYMFGSLVGVQPIWVSGPIGRELWKTDGTEAGTVLVRDIRAGSESSNISSLTNLAGTLLFVAADSDAGYEIWRSDGTEAGTMPVTNSNFTESRKPERLVVVGPTAYFTTENPTDGSVELWKTDGTQDGTSLVKNIWPGSWLSRVGDLIDVAGVLHFTAYDPNYDDGRTKTIWKSDGTSAGTLRVTAFPQGAEEGVLVAAAGRIFANPLVPGFGVELWAWDGASSSLQLVRDIREGLQGSGIKSFTAIGGVVYFAANDGLTGAELWRSDGTAGGTYRVQDIQSRYYNKQTWQPRTNAITVAASPGQGASERDSDVSSANILLPPFDFGGSIGSEPDDFHVVDGTLFFTAFDDLHGRQVWRTDGTDAGTIRLGGLPPSASRNGPAYFTEVGSYLYFVNAGSLWRTNGSVAGTKRVDGAVPELATIYWTGLDGQRFVSERTRPLARLGLTLLFSGTGGSTGGEPWKISPAAPNLPLEV